MGYIQILISNIQMLDYFSLWKKMVISDFLHKFFFTFKNDALKDHPLVKYSKVWVEKNMLSL